MIVYSPIPITTLQKKILESSVEKLRIFFWKLYFSNFDGNFISQSISILALILIIDQSFQITHKMMERIGLLSTEFMFYVCTIMY